MGTVAMTAFLLLPRILGWGKIDVILAVGALITKNPDRAFSYGYVLHFLSGIVFAYIYWGLLTLLSLPIVWWTFGLAGFIHGIIVMLLVSIAVMEHHPVAKYHERGPMTGVAQLLAHIIYGVVVGAIIHGLR